MSADAERVARGFDRLSPWYDLMARALLGGEIPRSQAAWLHRIEGKRTALIVGGGAGRFLIDLLRRGDVQRVVCLDVSSGMLRASRRRLSREAPDRISHVEFRRGGVERLGGEERFELVCTHCFLDLFQPRELRRVMRRLDTALAAGGDWLCSDFVEPGGSRLRDRAQRVILRVLYEFFGATCGIAPRRMPPIEETFERMGYRVHDRSTFAAGLLWSGRLGRSGT